MALLKMFIGGMVMYHVSSVIFAKVPSTLLMYIVDPQGVQVGGLEPACL
jgi:hypothetical protein